MNPFQLSTYCNPSRHGDIAPHPDWKYSLPLHCSTPSIRNLSYGEHGRDRVKIGKFWEVCISFKRMQKWFYNAAAFWLLTFCIWWSNSLMCDGSDRRVRSENKRISRHKNPVGPLSLAGPGVLGQTGSLTFHLSVLASLDSFCQFIGKQQKGSWLKVSASLAALEYIM